MASLLRRLRERRGLSQAAAAALGGLQPQTVGRIERDDGDVRLDTLRRYLEGLGYAAEIAVTETDGRPAGRARFVPPAEPGGGGRGAG